MKYILVFTQKKKHLLSYGMATTKILLVIGKKAKIKLQIRKCRQLCLLSRLVLVDKVMFYVFAILLRLQYLCRRHRCCDKTTGTKFFLQDLAFFKWQSFRAFYAKARSITILEKAAINTIQKLQLMMALKKSIRFFTTLYVEKSRRQSCANYRSQEYFFNFYEKKIFVPK